ALGAIFAYVLAVGAQPSVVRAGVAGALGSLAWLTARGADRWHLLLVGAIVLLAWNPYTLLDAGFQLSFAAVSAIFLLVPRFDRTLQGYPFGKSLRLVVAVSAACGLATAPIAWLQFHTLQLLTVPANALAAPVVMPLLGLALGAAVEVLSAGDASGGDAVAACNSMGLLGSGQRLVIIGDVERWKAADVKTLAAYLADPAPDTVLALVAAELKKDSALSKACAKAGEILTYDVPKRRLGDWVSTQFRERGVQVDPEAARVLVEIVGEKPVGLASEVDKITTWAGSDPVGVGEIEQLAAGCAEVPGYELTDAWGRRDLAGVLTSCQ